MTYKPDCEPIVTYGAVCICAMKVLIDTIGECWKRITLLMNEPVVIILP